MGSDGNLNQDKMYIVNKLFGANTIRTVWDNEAEKYYLSVVDVVGVLTESKDSQAYWRKLKQRLRAEGNETVTNCHGLGIDNQLVTNCNQLKLKAADEKYRLTDVVDIEGMFRVIESIPSKNAKPVKQWLAKTGGKIADNTRKDIEKNLGRPIVTSENNLPGNDSNLLPEKIPLLL